MKQLILLGSDTGLSVSGELVINHCATSLLRQTGDDSCSFNQQISVAYDVPGTMLNVVHAIMSKISNIPIIMNII